MNDKRQSGRGIRTECDTNQSEYTKAQLEIIKNIRENVDNTLCLLEVDADRPSGRGLRSAYTNKLDERYSHA